MRVIKLQCPHCGATFKVEEGSDIAICQYCGTQVKVPHRQAKITVKRTALNKRPFFIFIAASLVIVIAATIILSSVLLSKSTDPSAYKSSGVYLVGEDLPAGEYVLYPNLKKDDGDVTPVVEVRKTKDTAVDKSDFLYRKEFYGRQYVNLNDGEYIAFEYALLYKKESVKLKPLGKDGYSSAQLKVGEDIEAGEYVIAGDAKQTQYFITGKPEAGLFSTAALNSPDMLNFDYCENRIYLKVEEGQYLTFFGGKLYKAGDVPLNIKEGIYQPAQYKVGIDIQSGKYTVSPTQNKRSQAWVCINKNAVKTGSISSWETENKYVGGETLLFIRLEDYEGDIEIDIPKSDGDLYVTFWYCTAELSSADQE